MKKLMTFKNGVRGKYAGMKLTVVGDRRLRKNPEGMEFLLSWPDGSRTIKIIAPNQAEARREFLRKFNLEKMPAGMRIEQVAEKVA